MNSQNFNNKIGSQIRDAREKKDYSCQQMADFLNCAKSTYNYYERGVYSIPIERLIKLCNYLGLDWVKVVDYANK